jgi:CheY-like chemotaxis protein
MRALLRGQEEGIHILREILAIVRSLSASNRTEGTRDDLGSFGGLSAEAPAEPQGPSVRKRRRRKSVLLVDDDDEARQATEAVFVAAQVPVRAVADGRAAMTAIAAEKPDVIVLELGLSEPMTGTDVINMIKATMEWLDIPIVLYTRLPIHSQQEARTIHGADDLVLKGSANADVLVARAIQIFQRED